MNDLQAELAFAHDLADAVDPITLSRIRATDLAVTTKADLTPVTEADTAAESTMRRLIAATRPGHAVLGEEEGLIGDPNAEWQWVLDPIDGTANYVRGVPIWATLIALRHREQAVVGLVSAPALNQRWWAVAGGGSFTAALGDRAGTPIRVSGVNSLTDSFVGHSSTGGWFSRGRGPQFVELCERVWRSRGLGDFWMHCLVAQGAMDVAIEPIVSLWDLVAVDLLVREAGGRFTDLEGGLGPDGGSAASTNGLLHDEVLGVLARR
ncbi:MAG: hisN [Acidimicrobiia bacterium]|nr:hisN [Acidimicrobiia bacterium]